jgi:hypothetical protein
MVTIRTDFRTVCSNSATVVSCTVHFLCSRVDLIHIETEIMREICHFSAFRFDPPNCAKFRAQARPPQISNKNSRNSGLGQYGGQRASSFQNTVTVLHLETKLKLYICKLNCFPVIVPVAGSSQRVSAPDAVAPDTNAGSPQAACR